MAKDRDDAESGISGRRNKSWREIDSARGKSGYGSRGDDPKAQKAQQSPSYEKYKKAAAALFTPGAALPEGLAATFDPEGKRKEQSEAMMKLREAPDRKAWVQLVIEFLEKYPELPEDAYFLNDLLDHPRARIVDKALGKLEALHAEGKLKGSKLPPSLKQRLTGLELTSMDPETKERARALRVAAF